MVNGTGITFSGLASGLDTQAIIQQLVKLERIPITLIEGQKSGEQAKLDKLGDFEALVKALQTAAEKVSTVTDFYAWTVGNTDPTVATITATGGASAGSHSLEVQQLASIDRWAFDAVSDPNVDLASADGQQLSFDFGTTNYVLTVDQSSSSLNDIAGDIEDMAGADVTAEVVNTGTASNPQYRLVLASKESGEDFRIANITTDIAGLDIDWKAPDANGNPKSDNNLTVGLNAEAIIDGLLFERSSNDFSDVYQGLEINLLSTTETDTPITFSIDPDKDGIRANVDGFVEAYNKVVQFINQQSIYTPGEEEGEAGTTGALFGDTILKTVRGNLRRALYDVDPGEVAADPYGYSTLALIGIGTKSDGTLEVDSTVFDEKLAGDIDLLADLFVDSDGFDNGGADPNTKEFYQDTTADSGLAASLVREIERMFGTYEGPIDPDTGEPRIMDAVFDLKETTIRESIDRLDDQIDAMERRLEDFERVLIIRFTRLEELMGALNAQGAALQSAFPSS